MYCYFKKRNCNFALFDIIIIICFCKNTFSREASTFRLILLGTVADEADEVSLLVPFDPEVYSAPFFSGELAGMPKLVF